MVGSFPKAFGGNNELEYSCIIMLIIIEAEPQKYCTLSISIKPRHISKKLFSHRGSSSKLEYYMFITTSIFGPKKHLLLSNFCLSMGGHQS